jgi:hypothetical protein
MDVLLWTILYLAGIFCGGSLVFAWHSDERRQNKKDKALAAMWKKYHLDLLQRLCDANAENAQLKKELEKTGGKT